MRGTGTVKGETVFVGSHHHIITSSHHHIIRSLSAPVLN